MQRSVLLLFFLVGFARCQIEVYQDHWTAFKEFHNKSYVNEVEEAKRMNIFVANSHMVAEHNDRYINGIETYSMKINQFGDLTNEEFVNIMRGVNATIYSEMLEDENAPTFIEPNVQIPRYIDWRKKGAVTYVKNQGSCGSCWSFSATGALEAQHFRKTKHLISLSEQNLIDCSVGFGNNGCNGGLPSKAFDYIKKNHGIDSEKSYPYKMRTNYACRYNRRYSGAKLKGYVTIPKSEYKLKQAVATRGPVSVLIDQNYLQFYSGGIFYNNQCKTDLLSLNHAVLVVGYGWKRQGGSYWLIKNSWGKQWGERGYLKLARNRGNACGVSTLPVVPYV